MTYRGFNINSRGSIDFQQAVGRQESHEDEDQQGKGNSKAHFVGLCTTRRVLKDFYESRNANKEQRINRKDQK
jgi:hypothetical protein